MNNSTLCFLIVFFLALGWNKFCDNHQIEAGTKYFLAIVGGIWLFSVLMAWSNKPDTEEDKFPDNEL